jgi:hypothetical protein
VQLPDGKRSRVILLGSSEYEDAEHDIPQVRKTVDDLQAALTDPEYGIVPSERCTVLLNERDLPTLGRTLRDAMADAEDLLLVYFAGHGIIGARHRLYLGMYHSDWENPGFSALKYEELRDAILENGATTKVVILDCCFAGRAIGDSLADKVATIVDQLGVDGTYLLTSSQQDEVSLVLSGEEHTAFTGRMLRLLRDGVPEEHELLTIDDVYRQLCKVMRSEGLPVPQKRGTKNADLLAISRNRAFTPNAAEILRQRMEAALERGRRGEWPAVITELHKVWAEQCRILGDHDKDTLRTRQFLAQATGAAGNPVVAARLLTEVLAEQMKQLGSDHEDTLQSRQFLAVSIGETGRRGEAVAMLRVLLPDRRRVLGADHDAVMRTQHVLARYLAMSGVFDEAVALFRELLSDRERLLGSDHADTERTRRDLADVERRCRDGVAVPRDAALAKADFNV